MKLVQEIRERQAFEQPKRANPFPIILGVIASFCIGAIGVGGFMHAPDFIKSQITEAMARSDEFEPRLENTTADFGVSAPTRISNDRMWRENSHLK